METVDAVVVGAGPAGSTAAFGLARKGWSVLLAEEHQSVGRPIQCAGLVSQRVLNMAGNETMVLHRLGGASIWGPSLKRLRFAASETRAFVIARDKLDCYLADKAVDGGARLQTGWKFTGMRDAPGRGPKTSIIEFRTQDGRVEIASRMVVGADGVSSSVARSLKLKRPIEILPAYETVVPFPQAEQDEVEIYLSHSIAPGFFGWSIPDGHGNIRLGVAMNARTGMNAKEGYGSLLKAVTKEYGRTLPSPTEVIVSGIPIGVVPKTVNQHGLIVGDAAAQVKPLSGGGIYTGMRSAQIAADAASNALSSTEEFAERLLDYEALWRKEVGTELEKALFFRRLFVRLTDTELDRLVEMLRDSRLVSTIVAFGDIDFPTITAGALLRQSPSLARLFPKALAAFLRRKEGLVPDLSLDLSDDRIQR
jgi:geranylgeranyl reductase family protein